MEAASCAVVVGTHKTAIAVVEAALVVVVVFQTQSCSPCHPVYYRKGHMWASLRSIEAEAAAELVHPHKGRVSEWATRTSDRKLDVCHRARSPCPAICLHF